MFVFLVSIAMRSFRGTAGIFLLFDGRNNFSIERSGPGDWNSDRPIHWCRGCCNDRATAVDRLYNLVTLVLWGGHVVSNRSLSDYGKVSCWPNRSLGKSPG